MDRPDRENFEAARAKLVGLLVECPMDPQHKGCPLSEKRSLPFSNKLDWLKSLPVHELQNIYSAHVNCLKTKDSELVSLEGRDRFADLKINK